MKKRLILTAMIITALLLSAMGSLVLAWGGGGGHISSTGQCIVCHDTNLQTIHQVSWTNPDRTGCYICHPTGRKTLYSYLVRSFDCIKCHNLSGVPVDYHMYVDTKHISTEPACMKCHGEDLPTPIASLTLVHQGIGAANHLPLTVACPSAVYNIADDIDCYCLECHKNPVRIPILPANADCTSCHVAGEYNAKLNLCSHDSILKALQEAGIDVTSHTTCKMCHIKCP